MRKTTFRLLLAAIFSVFGAIGANAAAIDLGAIELGKVYNIPMGASVTATITPTVSGKLMQDGVPDLEIKGLSKTSMGYGKYGQVYSYNVTAGTTYELSCDFIFNGGDVCFYQENSEDFKIEILEVLPAEGAQISPVTNLTGELQVKFNTEVKYKSASLLASGETVALSNSSIMGNTLSFPIADAMQSLYTKGAISTEGGTPVALVIDGISTTSGVKYNGNGQLLVAYTAAPKLAMLTGTKNCENGTPFKSYYMPDDPAALLSFFFDTDIAPGCFLSISAGNLDTNLDNYFYEEIPCKTEGNTVTVSLAGKLRDLNETLVEGDNLVGIKLNNVRDVHGNYAMASSGNVGSYPYTFIYDYIEPFDITSEFIPASGASLAGVNDIEIAFNHAEQVTFEGVRFTYDNDGIPAEILVPRSECKTSLDYGWMTINLAKPAALEGKNTITVNLYGMQSVDGYDHTASVQAEYDQFVVTLLAPHSPGEVLATTGTEPWIIFCNEEPAYLRYDFYNKQADGADIAAYGADFTMLPDGSWSAPNGDIKCYTDFKPYMLVRAYESKEAYATDAESFVKSYKIPFVGRTHPFEFSPTVLTAITPAGGAEIDVPADGFCFTLEFDGLVTLNTADCNLSLGDGTTVPFASLEAVEAAEDEPDYANTWRLWADVEILNSTQTVIVTFRAFDPSGALVEGNQGSEDSSSFAYTYKVKGGAGVSDITTDKAPDAVYYNLQGVRVGNPRPGNVYIHVSGTKAAKTIIR